MGSKLLGAYRQTFTTGAVTTIAAGTATAGHLFAIRNTAAGRQFRLTALEVEFILTTAFGAAQEVGFDVYMLGDYTTAHSGATALTLNDGAGRYMPAYSRTTSLVGRIADAGALTAGVHTMETNAIARGSCWGTAIGAMLATRRYDFAGTTAGGFWFGCEEGFLIRNTVLMGATGVGKWHITTELEEYEVT